MRTEDERLACDDRLSRILAAGEEEGFPDYDDIRVGGPCGKLSGGVYDEDAAFSGWRRAEC